jgi:hypothetical protein
LEAIPPREYASQAVLVTVSQREGTIFGRRGSNAKSTAKVEGSTFANLIGGPEQKRIIASITADELRFTNPRTLSGESLEFVWKQAKE